MDAWANFPSLSSGRRPPSQRLALVVGALLLVGVAYVIWNPLAEVAEPPAPTPAPAATAESGYFLRAYEDPSPAAAAEVNGWAVALDMGIKLLLVVGLIYLTAWGLRAVMGKARLGPARAGRLGVLETTALAPNRSLYLVEVGGKVLLLGATPTQLTLLSEFSDPDVVKELRGESDFARQLEASAARLDEGAFPHSAASASARQAFIEDCLRELRQISQRFGWRDR